MPFFFTPLRNIYNHSNKYSTSEFDIPRGSWYPHEEHRKVQKQTPEGDEIRIHRSFTIILNKRQ